MSDTFTPIKNFQAKHSSANTSSRKIKKKTESSASIYETLEDDEMMLEDQFDSGNKQGSKYNSAKVSKDGSSPQTTKKTRKEIKISQPEHSLPPTPVNRQEILKSKRSSL